MISLVSTVCSQEIGWEEHLQSDLVGVEWNVKLYLSQSYCHRFCNFAGSNGP